MSETLFGNRVFANAVKLRCGHNWIKAGPKSNVWCPCKTHTHRENTMQPWRQGLERCVYAPGNAKTRQHQRLETDSPAPSESTALPTPWQGESIMRAGGRAGALGVTSLRSTGARSPPVERIRVPDTASQKMIPPSGRAG